MSLASGKKGPTHEARAEKKLDVFHEPRSWKFWKTPRGSRGQKRHERYAYYKQ